MKTLEHYTKNLKHTLDQLPLDLIDEMIDCLHNARIRGKRVFTIGNGGSASTASHLACDLSKNTVTPELPSIRAIALTDNMAVFSAIANDLGYENVFAEQLDILIESGDIVIAISASGNSANVLKAIKLAKARNAFTIGWSGYDGGALAAMVDLPVVIPNHCIEQIEDVHLTLAHMVTTGVRQAAIQEEPLHLHPEPLLAPRYVGMHTNGIPHNDFG
jgi:D-sedoheptulose 7-phosphate isomerase